MANANITINQAGKPAGVAGAAREDLDLFTGLNPVVFTNQDDVGVVSWQWTLIDRPNGSVAALAGAATPSSTLNVDVAGSYLVRLVTVDGAGNVYQDETIAAVVLAIVGWRIPAAFETTQFHATRGWAEELDEILRSIAAGGPLFVPLQSAYDDGPGIVTGAGGAVTIARGAGTAVGQAALAISDAGVLAPGRTAALLSLRDLNAGTPDSLWVSREVTGGRAVRAQVFDADQEVWSSGLFAPTTTAVLFGDGDLVLGGAAMSGGGEKLRVVGLVESTGMRLNEGIDVAAAADRGVLYTKDVGGVTELFYRKDSGGGGSAIVQLTPVAAGGGTLDACYDFGGAGAGRTITADAGAVAINALVGAVALDLYPTTSIAGDDSPVLQFQGWVVGAPASRSIYALNECDAGTDTYRLLFKNNGAARMAALDWLGGLTLPERASKVSPAPGAGFGSFWVLTGAPCVPYFTDDADADHRLAYLTDIPPGGGSLQVAYDLGASIVEDATGPVMISSAVNDATNCLELNRTVGTGVALAIGAFSAAAGADSGRIRFTGNVVGPAARHFDIMAECDAGADTSRLRISNDSDAPIAYFQTTNVRFMVTGETVDISSDLLFLESTASGATGQELRLVHNSASPADLDDVADITFYANSTAALVEWGRFRCEQLQVGTGTDTEEGQFFWSLRSNDVVKSDFLRLRTSNVSDALFCATNTYYLTSLANPANTSAFLTLSDAGGTLGILSGDGSLYLNGLAIDSTYALEYKKHTGYSGSPSKVWTKGYNSTTTAWETAETIALMDQRAYTIDATVTAINVGRTKWGSFKITVAAHREGGGAVLDAYSVATIYDGIDTTWDVTAISSGNNILIQVQGNTSGAESVFWVLDLFQHDLTGSAT